jgi:hypothetical protein
MTVISRARVTDLRERGEKISVDEPAVAQVSVEPTVAPAAPQTTAAASSSAGSAHLYAGGICLQFPLSIEEADLQKLIRVARQISASRDLMDR